MKEKILKTILVSMLIVVLTIFDFILLGQNIAIAISEEIESATNVRNVEFAAYLKEDSNSYVTEEQTLMLAINVKEKGVLNEGKIQIENANFTILKDKVQDTFIKNINDQTNEIELNSIIYQNEVNIELPIVFKKQDTFEADYFEREISIKLEGNYKDEAQTKVEAKRALKINWTVEQADIAVNQDIKTYKEVEGIGILLNQDITTEVVGNVLPREGEILSVQVPTLNNQQPSEVYVIYNKRRLPEENAVYRRENNTLEINNTSNLTWGNAVNRYQVIYIYNQSVGTNKVAVELNTTTNTKLFTKEAIQKQHVQTIEVETKGNVISIEKTANSEIYKGYLYAKTEETVFTEQNKIQITNKESANYIELTKAAEEFTDGNSNFDITNKVIYKNTIINKEEFEYILGSEGQITITDAENQVLSVINKDTQADENGNIVINYENEIGNLKITTTKPVTEGEMVISNTRAIKADNEYTKEQLKTFNNMITRTKLLTDKEETAKEAAITLLDSKTEAKLEISNSNLSTLQTNENVQLLLTLKSDGLEYDLYKNPTVKITLPSDLKINVKNMAQLNLQDEIIVENPILYENDNGEQVIEMSLKGEQTHFENSVNQGIQVSIIADVNIDKTIPSKNSEIRMIYTNENRPGEEFSTVVPIQLNSKYGVLMVSSLSNYNANGDVVESIDDKVKKATVDVNSEAREANQSIAIVNNYEEAITDVAILGKMPTVGEKEINGEKLKATFEMNLTNAIQAEENTKVYYSENPDELKDSTAWTESPADFSKVRAFKVELDDATIEPKEVVHVSYPVAIPEGLEENELSYSNVNVSYSYLGDNVASNSTISLHTEEKEGPANMVEEVVDGLKIEISGKTGGKALYEGQEVYEGQGVKYIVRITNTTEEAIENLKINATQSNANFYDIVTYHDGWDSINDIENVDYQRIEEVEKDSLSREIGTINPGETKEVSYQISVREVEGEDKTTSGEIQIMKNESEIKRYNTYTNLIKQADLKLQIRDNYEVAEKLKTGGVYPFFFDVTNLSNETKQNIMLKLEIPEGFYFQNSYLWEAQNDEYRFVSYENRILTVEILQINAKEKLSIRLAVDIEAMDLSLETKTYNFLYTGTLGDNTYVSQEQTQCIYNMDSIIEAVQTGSIEGEEVQDGDKLNYTITVENKGPKEKFIQIMDTVPTGAVVEKAIVQIYQGDTLVSTEEREDIIGNSISHIEILEVGKKCVITIETTINTDQISTNEITNKVAIITASQNVECNEVTYKVKRKEEEKPPIIDPNPADPDATYSISGTAWLDKNKNGLRESSEQKLGNIDVALINETTGEIAKDFIKTDENGNYKFENIKQGKYLVAFLYDNKVYRVTEYQTKGVNEQSNSDVVSKKIELQGKEEIAAVTGSLELTNADLKNIDAGFIKNEKFDLKLDKSISKVIVQNSNGTTVNQYANSKLAKIEIDRKQLANSTILIEYQIQVTNEGEIPGYASEIVDYKPSDLVFNSEINKNWYQSTDGSIYSKALANQIINVGETKVITLTLMKNMNQENTGTTINTAEISKANNEFSLQDIDSTPGNKNNDEDDISTAELIISIRTGSIFTYTILITLIIGVIATGIYFIKKKVLSDTNL